MENLERLVRAIDEEFGQTKNWKPLIEAAKRELLILQQKLWVRSE